METSNLGGKKLSKNALQIHLVGTLDELNAHLGLVKVKVPNEKDKKFLETIQTNIMKMMSHVSDPANDSYHFTETEVTELKNEIENIKEKLPKDCKFVLPGKNETDAFIHIARTVARRAERYYAGVSGQASGLSGQAGLYLNKLSDYLFYLSLVV